MSIIFNGNQTPSLFLRGLKNLGQNLRGCQFFRWVPNSRSFILQIQYFMLTFLEKTRLEKLVLIRKKPVVHKLYVSVHDGKLVKVT